MPRLLPVAALLLALFVIACNGEDDNAASSVTSDTESPATTAPAVSASEDKPTPAPTPPPGAASVANEPFSVETSDGVVLKGHAYTPDGPKRQALIIVAPVDQSIWAESTSAFTSEGIAVFSFDLRGYGETGGEPDAAKTSADAQLVSRFVMSREYPLAYLFGVGADAGEAASQAAAELDSLAGVITYGYAGDGPAGQLSLAPETAWDGDDVLADSTTVEPMLETILGGN